MDRAYADNKTLQLALGFGFLPVVPPKSNRMQPGSTTKPCTASTTRLRGFSAGSKASAASLRFEKLAVLFLGFLTFALIVEALR